jgi:hypothetical protein
MLSSGALSSLGLGGVLITLGCSAGRQTTIDVTDLIWKRARMAGFSLFAQSPTAIATACATPHHGPRQRYQGTSTEEEPGRRASISPDSPEARMDRQRSSSPGRSLGWRDIVNACRSLLVGSGSFILQ